MMMKVINGKPDAPVAGGFTSTRKETQLNRATRLLYLCGQTSLDFIDQEQLGIFTLTQAKRDWMRHSLKSYPLLLHMHLTSLLQIPTNPIPIYVLPYGSVWEKIIMLTQSTHPEIYHSTFNRDRLDSSGKQQVIFKIHQEEYSGESILDNSGHFLITNNF